MRASPISLFSFTAAACLGSLSIAHADYLVVDDDGGPGVDHTTLVAAVQAASNGDRILVHPGDDLGAITTSKAIAIIGLGASDDDRPRVTEVHWSGLGPYQQASLSGFRLGAVSLTQCAGTVSLVDLAVDTWGGNLDYRAIGVEDCADVRIRDLALTGFADQVYTNGVLLDNNHGALHVRNSRVEVVGSRIRGPLLGDISGRAAGI